MDFSEAQYDAFAAEFERHAQDSAYNAFYDRPALLDLIGDVSGRRVLDAGCGPGLYAAELVRRGATVTAFDESTEMVRLARVRLGRSAHVRRASLGEPLTWLPNASQDVAVVALVLHHLDDRVPALVELRRVLVPHGRLVLSTVHPTFDWLQRGGGDYFAIEPVEELWQQTWRVRYWRQPLERWCAEFANAGFRHRAAGGASADTRDGRALSRGLREAAKRAGVHRVLAPTGQLSERRRGSRRGEDSRASWRIDIAAARATAMSIRS